MLLGERVVVRIAGASSERDDDHMMVILTPRHAFSDRPAAVMCDW